MRTYHETNNIYGFQKINRNPLQEAPDSLLEARGSRRNLKVQHDFPSKIDLVYLTTTTVMEYNCIVSITEYISNKFMGGRGKEKRLYRCPSEGRVGR